MKPIKQTEFIFQCPFCGGRDLHSAERATNWYKVIRIAKQGNLPAIDDSQALDITDEVSMGYRCGNCNYPDQNDLGEFRWKTLEEAINNKAIIQIP
ncbi:MAG: hypothetical protein RR719_08715 [Akkermansia sp.]